MESSWSLIQLRPGLGQGTERVGQPPALPELLVNWRCCIPAAALQPLQLGSDSTPVPPCAPQ